jgi:hypothetical protein
MATDDKYPSVNKIFQFMGETQKGIANLEARMDQAEREHKELDGQAVRKPECTERHRMMAQSIGTVGEKLDSLRTDIKNGGAKKGTLYWLSVIGGGIVLLSFFGGLALGLMRMGQYWERVNQTMEQVQQQQVETTTAIREAAKKAAEPKVIRVWGPSDAGVAKRRRVPRRRSARPPGP